MPVLVPSEVRCHTRATKDFGALYVALVLLSFHAALVLYINSSFIETYISKTSVSSIYIMSALLTVCAFLIIPKILNRFGNVRTVTALTIIEGAALLAMPTIHNPLGITFLFTVHQIAVPLLLFTLDIFMESLTGNCEKSTGGRRGLFLTIMSLTIALSALLSGYLMGDSEPHYTLVYTTSALLLIPFLLIIRLSFKHWTDTPYHETNHVSGFARLLHERDLRNVLLSHFMLQLFFSWMVIYMPLYLHSTLGLSWSEVGHVLFVGLMAYVLLEYVIGVLADTLLGEKEMMALGFLILAVSTSWFTFLDGTSLALLMCAMFFTRVGASLVETTTESYFFKHTKDEDTALISFFRITRPLSIVVGAILGILTLFFVHNQMNLLFAVLGFLMIPGFFFTMRLRDTR